MLASGLVFAAPTHAAEAAPPPASVLSPDGKQAAWVSDDAKSIFGETREGAHWTDPAQLLNIRGTVGKLVFSPDSKQLAFENPRGDHGFIGVYDIQSAQIDYVDPSFGTDSSPTWTPSGKQISFVRSYPGI